MSHRFAGFRCDQRLSLTKSIRAAIIVTIILSLRERGDAMSDIEEHSNSRRSWLHLLILNGLRDSPARTITALADRIDRKRPAVSRSLKQLTSSGLVEHTANGWVLTSAGERETLAQSGRVRKSVDDLVATYRRAAEAVQVPNFANVRVGGSWTGDFSKQVAEAARLDAITKQFSSDALSRAGQFPQLVGSAALAHLDEQSRLLERNQRDALASNFDAISRAMGPDQRRFAELVGPVKGFIDTASAFTRDSPQFMREIADASSMRAQIVPMGDVAWSRHLAEQTSLLDTITKNAFGPGSRDAIHLLGGDSLKDTLAHISGDAATKFAEIAGYASKAQEATSQMNAFLSKEARFPDMRLFTVDSAAINDIMVDSLRLGEFLGAHGEQVDRLVAPARSAIDDYARVLDRYSNLHNERVHLVAQMPTLAPHDALQIILPTTTVRDYGRSVRGYIAAETEPIKPQRPRHTPTLAAHLDPRLERLDRRLVNKRRGVWDVLASDSHDKVAQAAHSARELLRMVLDQLAPEEAMPADTAERPTRKARVRFAFRSRIFTSYVEAMATAVDEMYGRLSGIAHGGNSAESAVIAVVIACEGLILNMLVALEEDSAE